MKKVLLFSILLIVSVVVSRSYAQKNQDVKALGSTILTTWMDVHCRMVRSVKGIPHVAYSRHFAYAALAAYESIVGSDASYRSLAGQVGASRGLPSISTKIYWPASLNAAYAAMLREFYSSFDPCKARIDSVERAQKKQFDDKGINIELINQSETYGQSVAAAIIQWSQTDGADNSQPYTPEKGVGLWEPTPPSFASASVPYWAEKRSFSNDLVTIFDLKRPVFSVDTTSSFYAMAKEVYTVGLLLTPEQKAIALFWDDSPNGKYMTVFGHWTSILSGLIKKHQFPLLKASEAYVKMTLAMHDASILAWKGKYQYKVVRPVTYIQQHIDKNWMPLIPTPPHPEFPAAHATLSNAAATALCASFGKSCPVTDNSYIDIGMDERKYASIQDVAHEAGMSRLYGGIHYRYSIEQGFILGEKTAKHIVDSIIFQARSGNEQKETTR